jgi:hypothetical protein
VHEPDDNAHVTSDEPAFEAFTVPDAPTSNAETSTKTVGVSSDVTSSDDDTPESLSLLRSGTPNAGDSVSITIAFAPAMLLVPDGKVVELIGFPTVSSTVPMTKFKTVRSAEFSPAAMVYVPTRDVPADAAVRVTVAPVSSVTTIVFPDCTSSLVVAVILTDCDAR